MSSVVPAQHCQTIKDDSINLESYLDTYTTTFWLHVTSILINDCNLGRHHVFSLVIASSIVDIYYVLALRIAYPLVGNPSICEDKPEIHKKILAA